MNPCELTAAITALANYLAAHMSDDELSLLSAVLTQLADTLAVIAVQRSIGKSECTEPGKKKRRDRCDQTG